VFSRSFVRHALSSRVASFEEEIRWLYLRPEHGRLPRIIEEAKRLIKTSEEEGDTDAVDVAMDEDVRREEEGAVTGKLTAGSLIPLKRTIAQLEKILDEWGDKQGQSG
jgi:hypothetical protein